MEEEKKLGRKKTGCIFFYQIGEKEKKLKKDRLVEIKF